MDRAIRSWPKDQTGKSVFESRFSFLDNDRRTDGFAIEQDFPVDEFDKHVVAGFTNDPALDVERAPMRYSLAPPQAGITLQYRNEQQDLRRNLSDIRSTPKLSSSPTVALSSPTLSALRNRSQNSQFPEQRNSEACQSLPKTPNRRIFPGGKCGLIKPKQRAGSLSTIPPPPVIQGIPLIPTGRLPDQVRAMFPFELFNAVQSKCFPIAYQSSDNLVLSAPTGCGKTAIMELAICKLTATHKDQDFKIVYQAPTKALCSERCRDWTTKFSILGLTCTELTGDVEYAHLKTVQKAHIIVATPEKWDSVTRKWRDNAKLMQMIKLFLVDEVHILNEKRGATLEAVVSRMKSTGFNVRFIALSATIPNSEDIATWLGRNPTQQYLPAHQEVFGDGFRPVKLDKYVYGFSCKPNDFALDNILTKEIPTFVARHANRKPVMIFCVTKNSANKTASTLAELWMSTEPHLRL